MSFEEIEQGAETTESPAPETSSSETVTETQPKVDNQEPKQTESEKPAPFHEHPRFKELIEEKNKYADQTRALEARLAQMETQWKQQNAPKKQEDALVARLKGIDPEFGDRFEQLNSTIAELNQLKEWKAQRDMEDLRSQAYSQIKNMHTEFKVTPELQSRYERDIEAMVARQPNLKLSDLKTVYKQVHEDYSKWVDSIKRAERESYTKAKAQDAKAPTSQPKGKTVNPSQAPEFSKDAHEARAQMIQRVLKQAKASEAI